MWSNYRTLSKKEQLTHMAESRYESPKRMVRRGRGHPKGTVGGSQGREMQVIASGLAEEALSSSLEISLMGEVGSQPRPLSPPLIQLSQDRTALHPCWGFKWDQLHCVLAELPEALQSRVTGGRGGTQTSARLLAEDCRPIGFWLAGQPGKWTRAGKEETASGERMHSLSALPAAVPMGAA